MEMIGKKFGKLKVVGSAGKDNHRNLLWLCQCDCGATTIQRTNTLNMGLVKSCGCFQSETARERMLNEGNPMWSDNPSLGALHTWVRERKPKPKHCTRCGVDEPYDLANISGTYKRDIDDYEWLCRKCHMGEDGRLDRLVVRNKSIGTKKNLSKKFTGGGNPMSKNWIVISPEGVRTFTQELRQFCELNGLSYVCMKYVARGHIMQHKNGWKCEYA